MRFNYVCIIILLLLFSCGKKKTNLKEILNSDNPIKISVARRDTSLELNEEYFNFEIIKLDSSMVVGEITKMQLVDNLIYFLDVKTNALYSYDLNGRFRWVYRKSGKGPGEYNKLLDFSVKGNSIYLFDNQLKEIELSLHPVFRKQNRMKLSDHYFSPTQMYVNKDRDFMLYSSDKGDIDNFPFNLATLDSTLSKVKAVYLKNVSSEGERKWQNLFAIQVNLNNTGFYYSEPLNDTIYSYNDYDKYFKRAFVINFGKNQAPKSYLRDSKPSLEDFWNSNYGGNISYIFSTDSILTFRTTIAGSIYHHFYDKTNNKVKNFSSIIFKSDMFEYAVEFIGCKQNKFYFKLEPYQLFEAYNFYKRTKYSSLSSDEYLKLISKKAPLFYKLLKGTNMNSNPILLSVDLLPNKHFKKND